MKQQVFETVKRDLECTRDTAYASIPEHLPTDLKCAMELTIEEWYDGELAYAESRLEDR